MSTPSLWRLAKNSIFLWVGLVFVPVGAVFSCVAMLLAMEDLAFARHGQTVAATVIDKSLQKADFDKNPSTRYFVRYRLATPAGPPVERTRDVSVEEWERLATGGKLNIRVLPGTQGDTRLSQDSNWPAVAALSVLGLIFIAIGGPMVFVGVREIRRQRKVWRSGTTVPAMVEAVAATSTRINGVQQWEIRYAYTDASGKKHKGRSISMPEAEARQWQKGDCASARFDPNATDSSIWLGNAFPAERN